MAVFDIRSEAFASTTGRIAVAGKVKNRSAATAEGGEKSQDDIGIAFCVTGFFEGPFSAVLAPVNGNAAGLDRGNEERE